MAVTTKRLRGKIMNDSTDAEYRDHASTWLGFTRLMTYSIIVVVLVLIGMAVALL